MTALMFANIVLVIGALTGMYCIAHHNKVGFIIFLGVEASMSYIGYATNNYGLVVAAVLYLIMNVYSYTRWTKAEKPRRAANHILIDAIKNNYNDSWSVCGRVLSKDARKEPGDR